MSVRETTEEALPVERVLVMPPDDSDSHWYCLYTRPRHEKSLAGICARENIRHYLPLRKVIRHYRSGRKERLLPLFPGYLFCCAGVEQRYSLSRQENLLSLLYVPDQQKLLGELSEVEKALTVSQELETVPYVKVGQRVRIIEGPFRGIIGFVSEVGRRFRVFLNVTLIGRSVPLEVDSRCVEPVS